MLSSRSLDSTASSWMKVWMLTFAVDVTRLCIYFFVSVGCPVFEQAFSADLNYNLDLYEFGLNGRTIVAHDWVGPYA